MSKALVAYFSASGVTAKAAQRVAELAGADLYEIKPEVPYTKKDLNWLNPRSRSSVEMKDKTSRPALAEKHADISAYDTVYLGFPIWWYTAPTVVLSFLESCDFSGKRVVVFMTSGSSGFGNTLADLKACVPASCTMTEGLRITRRTTDDAIRAML